MPVSFNSPARNLFLLGSSGGTVVTNFFKTILDSSTDGVFSTKEISYNYSEQNYILSGSGSNNNSVGFGWLEKRDYDAETDPDNPTSTVSFANKIQSTTSSNLILNDIELDSNNNIIACGITGSTPWIAKYSNAGVLDWNSTSNSGDVEYKNITSDSSGEYYASGNTTTSNSNAFIEKFDSSGNPTWGKSATILGRDIELNGIAVNDRSEVVSVGWLEDDSRTKAYLVKVDTANGSVLWDKTFSSSEISGLIYTSTLGEDVFIDSENNIYMVGKLYNTNDSSTKSFIIKLSPEGNIIWQKETDENIEYYRVKADGETGQVVTFGRYYDSVENDQGGLITKYTRGGDISWRRSIFSSYNGSDFFGSDTINGGGIALDADASFYYVLYTDDEQDGLNGTPTSYTFGKVSTSGNGLGGFEYDDGESETVYYDILNSTERIGRLSDGSVRNDTSDLITYPFNATRIAFDDYATPVSNKKRQMDDADNFEYSGSPAIRVADFLTKEYDTDGYGVPPQKNYIGLSESLQHTSTSNTGTTNNTWSRQSTNTTVTPNVVPNPIGVGSMAERYNISATNGRRLEYGVPSGVFVAGQQYTYSWWMKAITTNAQWNFQAVYAGSSNNSIRIADKDGNILEQISITNTTNYKPKDTEWHRVVWTFNANNTTGSAVGGYNDNGETGDLWYLWGAQLVDGPDPGKYYRNYTGTPENASGTEHAPSIVGGAYEFDQTEILQIGEIPGDFSEMTVEIWFKSDTFSNWQNPIDCNFNVSAADGSVPSGNIGPRLEINASGQITWIWGASITANDPKSSSVTSTISTNTWYHTAFTISGPNKADGEIFLNGSSVGVNTSAGGGSWYGEIRNLILGRGFVLSSRYFDGQVGEVRVYPKALTAAQVFQNYNATRSKYDGIAASTSPRIGPGILNSNNILNYDFSNAYTIERLEEIQDAGWSTKLTPSDIGSLGSQVQFGHCVAVGNGKIAVGVPLADEGATTNRGAVYVYNTDGTGETKITTSQYSGVSIQFGETVTIGSNKILVGSGAKIAFLYDLDGTNEVVIDPQVNSVTSHFSIDALSTKIYGNKIYIGDSNASNGIRSQVGEVYIYNLSDASLIRRLRASNTYDLDADEGTYGYSIDVNQNILVVGAAGSASGTGRVYTYDLNGDREQIIEGSDSLPGDNFGWKVAIDSGRIIVGTPYWNPDRNTSGISGGGGAYSYNFNGKDEIFFRQSNMSEPEELGDLFGLNSNLISGDGKIYVGARHFSGTRGTVYSYTPTGKREYNFLASDASIGDQFGYSLGYDDGVLAVGSRYDNNVNGSVYIYNNNAPSGKVLNLSSSSNTGTINGATFNPAGYFEYNSGDSLTFSNVTVSDGSSSTVSWTYECWIYPDAFTGSSDIADLLSDGNYKIQLEQGGTDAGKIRYDYSSNTTGFSLNAITAGQWNHVVVKFSPFAIATAVSIQTWINNTFSLNTGHSEPLQTVASSIGSNFKGKIAEARIYDKELTDAEREGNWNVTRGKYGL